MGHRILDKPRKLRVNDKRAKRVKNYCCPMLSWSLRIDEFAEFIELEISGNDAAHVPFQRSAERNHQCTDAERSIGGRYESEICLYGIAIPGPRSRVISVVPQIDLINFIALLILKDTPHRQRSGRSWADQIYVVDGSDGCS